MNPLPHGITVEELEKVYCKAFNKDQSKGADQLRNGVFAVASFVASKCEQKWIPVSERLPDKTMGCLVFDSGGRSKISIRLWEVGYAWPSIYTHWMPLPTPPTEGVSV